MPMRDGQAHPGRIYGWIAGGVALLLGAMIVLFALAWGGAHCSPVPDCQRSAELHAIRSILIVGGIAGLLGFFVRWLTGWAARGMAGRSSGERGAVSLAILLGSLWVTWKLAILIVRIAL